MGSDLIERLEQLIREWRNEAGPKWGMMSEVDEERSYVFRDCADELESVMKEVLE